MCHQLQNELNDFRRRDSGDHDDQATPIRRVHKIQCFEAWRNLSVRKVWIATGEKTAVYGLKRSEIQALLPDVALASDETTLQLNTCTGFPVATYMAEGDNYRLAASVFLPEQMEIWRRSCWRSWGTASQRETMLTGSDVWTTASEKASPPFEFTAANANGNPACRRTRLCCLR